MLRPFCKVVAGLGARATGRGWIIARHAGRSCWLFSSDKDKEPQQIHISAEELEQIKKIINKTAQSAAEGDGQANFFSNEQTQLSLQLMQITAKEQLKPFLVKYSSKSIQIKSDHQNYNNACAELLRCKFVILYKFINLGGNIIDRQIQTIYTHIAQNVILLREAQLTIFYRIIAAQIKNSDQSPLRHKLPPFPIIENPCHTNSQLVSLLLMVYPMQEDKIYVNYHLLSTFKAQNFRQGVQQPQKEVIYDPVHLMLMLKHFFYYQDVQKLVHKSFEVESIQDCNYHVIDELIKSQEQFVSRKVQALCFALSEGFDQICSIYLFKPATLLHKISTKQSIDLLKAVLTLKNVQKYSQSELDTTVVNLLTLINKKQEALVELSQDYQLQQNQNYKNLIEVLSIILAKKPLLAQLPEVARLVDAIFEMKGQWKVAYQQYSSDQLFDFVVCYKGWKDRRLKNNAPVFDTEYAVLRTILANYREEVLHLASVSHKQLFYVCFFADSFGCVDTLKCQRIVDELTEFSGSKNLNKNSVAVIQSILQKLNT